MKTHSLKKYIARYESPEVAEYVMSKLTLSTVAFDDGIPILHQMLVSLCEYRVVSTIMKKFLKHEVRRGRLTKERRKAIIRLFGYNCWGCQESQPNQMAHMEYGGCLYSEDA